MSQIEKQVLEYELLYQANIENDLRGIASQSDDYTRFKKFTPIDQEAIDAYKASTLKSDGRQAFTLRADDGLDNANVPFIPDMEEVPSEEEEDVLSPDDIARMRENTRDINIQIADYEERIYSRDHDYRDAEGQRSIYIKKQILAADLNEEELPNQARYDAAIDEIDILKTELEGAIAYLEEAAAQFKSMIDGNAAKLSEYQAKVFNIRKDNKAKLENMRQQLALNLGDEFSSVQQPNETEEEFLDRLKRIAETAPEAELDSAQRYAIKNFKTKLKELTRDPVKIEQVANGIGDTEEDRLANKIALLKIWPKIKKVYLERFGYDNPTMSGNDIMSELKLFLELDNERTTHSKENAIMDSLAKIVRNTTDTAIDNEGPSLEEELRTMELADETNLSNSPDYVMYALENNTIEVWKKGAMKETAVFVKTARRTTKKYVLVSFVGEQHTFQELFTDKVSSGRITYSDVAKRLQLTVKEFISLLANSNNIKLTTDNLFDRLTKSPLDNEPLDAADPSDATTRKMVTITRPSGKVSQQEVLGWGVRDTDEIPHMITFGEIKILGKKLFYDNVLSTRHKNWSTIPGFNKTKVSDGFVKLIFKMVNPNGTFPTLHEIDNLPKGEAALFGELAHLAKIQKRVVTGTAIGTPASNKERLEILHGEIAAGNNNHELVDEIYICLKNLIALGKITKTEAKKYMKQFI
jgi:hypothetical protein